MSYKFHRRNSPNHGGFGKQIPLPASEAVIHHWNDPAGGPYDPWGVVSYLTNPTSQVSAHEVIAPQLVVQLVDHWQPSWANGNAAYNASRITFECDPNRVDATIDTLIERLADLVRHGVLVPDFTLIGHQQVPGVSTRCPGAYQPRLAEIRQRATEALNPTPTPEEGEMYLIVEKARGMMVVGPGYRFPVPPSHVDDAHLIVTRVVHAKDPAQFDRLVEIASGGITAGSAAVSAAEVAAKLKVVAQ